MVRILMGSESDREIMGRAGQILDWFGIKYDVHVISAHRNPEELRKFIQESDNSTGVYIAGAGLAAHLPGVVASLTQKPVIGVPLYSKATGGVDALYSIVQMPSGVPVACVGIDNARNAAFMAARIIALGNTEVSGKYSEFVRNGCVI